MLFYIVTLGCKVNQVESRQAEELLIQKGWELNLSPHNCDLIIINTCTVTHIADKKSRQLIRKLFAENPKAKTIITGCSVENENSMLPHFKNSILVNKDNFLKTLSSLMNSINPPQKTFLPQNNRQMIIAQTGCSNFCSYCIIPYVRHAPMSLPLNNILDYVKKHNARGAKEIVLTGINLGTYNDQGVDLSKLIKRILSIKGNFRLRLGSIEPNLIVPELLELIASEEKLCPHLHIPLQGVTDKLLQAMNRKYSLADYLKLLQKIAQLSRLTTVTTDIILGFPGETEEDFLALTELLQKEYFLNVHLFPFSKRIGTAAYNFKNQITSSLKKERMKTAQQILGVAKNNYLKKIAGKPGCLLTEEINENKLLGYTEHYVYTQTLLKTGLEINQFIDIIY